MLSDQVRSDLKVAMKAKDTLRVSVLRMLLSEINYKQIEVQQPLVDRDVLAVVAREVKKRREAIASWQAAGRSAQVEAEKKEQEILEEYLPR